MENYDMKQRGNKAVDRRGPRDDTDGIIRQKLENDSDKYVQEFQGKKKKT